MVPHQWMTDARGHVITLHLPRDVAHSLLEDLQSLPAEKHRACVLEELRHAFMLTTDAPDFTERDADEAQRLLGLRGPLEGA